MPKKSVIRLYFGVCLKVSDLAEVLSVTKIHPLECPACGNTLLRNVKFCHCCGVKLNNTISEASDMDVFQVLSTVLGKPPSQLSVFLYNGYVCIGYPLADSNDGVAIYDHMPQYKPWKEMMELVQKYVNKDPLSTKSHLIKAAFFSVGGE